MEKVMNLMLEYTKRWDAVMMIDECDIFLEEREKGMIIRNAMVGIFLKLLEYHNGIIFLTTNRLTTIDPAVKSRINLALSYNKLTNNQKSSIWKALLSKHSIELKDDTVHELSSLDINGREIRNYLKMTTDILKSKGVELNDKNIMSQIKNVII